MERDPLLEELRQLPALSPPRELTESVAHAALAVLASGQAAPPPIPSPKWRAHLEFALYCAALPTALAGATAIYLSWAVSAASHLY
ncbi:MAG TPA: hypothetical protein PLW65_25030 [Pseudomonadota bacterium]|nr:hypothetical protein [Pseudomonadota bacterium]